MDFVIAVDGTAASGKGTLAGMLAADYGLPHLETGLLYRAVGLALFKAKASLDDENRAVRAARTLDLSRLVDPQLQSADAAMAASRVARLPALRAALFDLQRRFATQTGGAVLDGRDIGTVIAPQAAAKLYVDADVAVRAKRRWLQTSARGDPRTLDQIMAELTLRDAQDSGRETAPLTQAPDAVLLDTTEMSIPLAADAARRIVEAARVRWLAIQPG
jgi:cytidylate kinase